MAFARARSGSRVMEFMSSAPFGSAYIRTSDEGVATVKAGEADFA